MRWIRQVYASLKRRKSLSVAIKRSHGDNRGVITGIEVPLELAVVLNLVAGAVGVWAGRLLANRRLDPRRDPLSALMQPATFAEAISLADHRNAMRAGSKAVLHGQLDQIVGLRPMWNPDTNEQVRAHVAAVMRAGLRRGDQVSMSDSDGFTIVIDGADERAAKRIAARLRRLLARLHLPQIGSTGRLSASFGVAAGGGGEAGADFLMMQARYALKQALNKGEGHIVSASELEEVFLLPPPSVTTSSPAASAA
ncbi:diguanylate cyclase domain-containing protein [Porphyrobacter sp. HT-58-2]|uniref:diguanylate cyclase domain-containing protein n=1 Tax=Porphyrobacter sp. HT-58-2 TaxID=2023229 RepID=UPI0015594D4E|nr:diguanylate cyclase [Porphyrobacter sp. HT-58-2]